MVIDLGTGDGRAVLARAAVDPRSLVIGIDANAAAMAESSRRASRGRTRIDNAVFLVAPVEALPGALAGAAHVVTVTMPWGSLLRGALGLDRHALEGLTSVVASSGRVEVLASVIPSDGVPGLPCLDASAEPRIRVAWASEGFELAAMRPATRDDLLTARSSWARRLGDRPVWRLEFRRSIADWTGEGRSRGRNGGH